MQAIDRFMTIIATISKVNERGISISNLSSETGLPLATLHRFLTSLTQNRLIEFDESKKLYFLGDSWMQYGLQVYDQFDYVSKVRPLMDQLAATTNESVYLHKPLKSESMIIERIDGPNNRIKIIDQLGLCTPFPIGAVNEVIIANKTILSNEPNNSGLEEDYLNALFTQNYCILPDAKKDTVSIATPIINKNGDLIHVLSLSVLSFTFSDERKELLVKELLNTKGIIEETLKYI